MVQQAVKNSFIQSSLTECERVSECPLPYMSVSMFCHTNELPFMWSIIKFHMPVQSALCRIT